MQDEIAFKVFYFSSVFFQKFNVNHEYDAKLLT